MRTVTSKKSSKVPDILTESILCNIFSFQRFWILSRLWEIFLPTKNLEFFTSKKDKTVRFCSVVTQSWPLFEVKTVGTICADAETRVNYTQPPLVSFYIFLLFSFPVSSLSLPCLFPVSSLSLSALICISLSVSFSFSAG